MAVEALPPSKVLIGPASPLRPVCAPGVGASFFPQTASRKEMTMFMQKLWQRWLGQPATSTMTRGTRRVRLTVERLEDRTVQPSNISVP